jgi:GNAT superfamily N-acetyltransferase
MTATLKLRTYPRNVTLRDGGSITIKPLEREDESALLEFFLQIPEGDRFFLKDDVTSPGIIRDWTQNLDYDRAVPLVATNDGRIISEGAVVKRRGGARGHVGEIRLTVGPSWRNRGVGTEMIRALCEVASDADLDAVLFELVEDGEGPAFEAATAMGFIPIGRLEGGARDRDGHLHDLVTLAMPLGKYWSLF